MGKRERVLQALLDVLKTVPGVPLVERNRTATLPDEARPAVVLKDGDEDPATEKWQPGMPVVMIMRPHVWCVVESSDDSVGTDLNAMIRTIRRTVLSSYEGTIKPVIGTNGSIALGPTTTGFDSGMQAEGGADVEFVITYTEDPMS